jgi:CBS domain-containing protein
MICPTCGFENIQGSDNCDNCGADLRTVDIPRPGSEFEARLVGEDLATLHPASPLIVAPATPVLDAIRTMRDHNAEAVLVADDGHLVGIFTERDALLKVAGKSIDGVQVEDVMKRDPVVLRPHDSVAVAIHKMAVGSFRHIPLVDDGRPTGVVSSRDLFRHIISILD